MSASLSPFEIHPETVQTGVPVTVIFHAPAPSKSLSLHVQAVNSSQPYQAVPFTAPLKTMSGGDVTAEIYFSIPGEYRLNIGAHSTLLSVAPQRRLSFAFDFGISAIFTLIIAIGVFQWIRKRKIAL